MDAAVDTKRGRPGCGCQQARRRDYASDVVAGTVCILLRVRKSGCRLRFEARRSGRRRLSAWGLPLVRLFIENWTLIWLKKILACSGGTLAASGQG